MWNFVVNYQWLKIFFFGVFIVRSLHIKCKKILSKYENYVMRQFFGRKEKKIVLAAVAESLKFWLFHIFYLIRFAKIKIVKENLWVDGKTPYICHAMLCCEWGGSSKSGKISISMKFFSFLFCWKCFFSHNSQLVCLFFFFFFDIYPSKNIM